MKKLPFLIFLLVILYAIFYLYSITLEKNVIIKTNIEDAQVRYRILNDDFKSKKSEFYKTKAYSELGRTPLEANLPEGEYILIIAKSGHVPVIEKITISEEVVNRTYHMEPGYRFVGEGSIEFRGKKLRTEGFYLAEKEVTNQEYIQFCEATGHPLPIYINDKRFNGKEHPVMGINFDDAVAYSRWRSDVSGLNVRLPTELEWMYAATEGDTNRVYPWGVHETTTSTYLANYHPFDMIVRKLLPKDVDGYEYTSPVGSYPRTDRKFYDLAGNVFEWCLDDIVLKDYKGHNLDTEVEKDPSLANHIRIVKGGSWNFNQFMMQVKNRVFVDGRIKKGNTGIRLLIEFD